MALITRQVGLAPCHPICPWCGTTMAPNPPDRYGTPFAKVPGLRPDEPATLLPKRVCGPRCPERPGDALVYALPRSR